MTTREDPAIVGAALLRLRRELPPGLTAAVACEGGYIGGWVLHVWRTGTEDQERQWSGTSVVAVIDRALRDVSIQ